MDGSWEGAEYNGTKVDLSSAMHAESSANIIVALFTSLLGLVILVGNGLIIVSVTMVRKLRQPANYLIVSLAFSDFLVGLVVLPLTITYDILEGWVFGAMLCNIHVSFDVICCTTSIMNLCMISIDRYLMITRPMTYPKRRTAKLMALMIASAWIFSCLIIIPALFGFTENVTDSPGFIELTFDDALPWKSFTEFNNTTSSLPQNNGNCFVFDLRQEYEITRIKSSFVETSTKNSSYGNVFLQVLQNASINRWSNASAINISSFSLIGDVKPALVGQIVGIRFTNNAKYFLNQTLKFQIYAEKTHGKTCLISQEVWFTIYSTVGAFYLPLAIMLCMYWKIYREASKFSARHESRTKQLEKSRNNYSWIASANVEDMPSSSVTTTPSIELLADETMQLSPSEPDIIPLSNGVNGKMSHVTGIDKCSLDGDIEQRHITKSKSTENRFLPVNVVHRKSASSLSALDSKSDTVMIRDNEEVFRPMRENDYLWKCFKSCHHGNSVYKNSKNQMKKHNNNNTVSAKYDTIPSIEVNNRTVPLDSDVRPSFRTRASIFSGSSAFQSHTSGFSDTIPRIATRRSTIFLNNLRRRVSTVSRDRMRNVKATRTLGIIVGTFTFCWVPFFILTFIRPFVCENPESQDCFPIWLVRLVLWLGYLNSALNPIIYIGFSPDLRETFKFLLCCKCTNVDRRLARLELRSAIQAERRHSVEQNLLPSVPS